MFESIDYTKLKESEALSEEEIETLRASVSIVDRRAWIKRAANIRNLSKEMNELAELAFDAKDLLETATEPEKIALSKQMNQYSKRRMSLVSRVEFQLRAMETSCIHPHDQCIKQEDGTIKCTFCNRRFMLRGVNEE